ncbi:MAG: lysophospholipid acyltransferase family protein [Acidobacteriota bacterium]
MQPSPSADPIFALPRPERGAIRRAVHALVSPAVERWLALDRLQHAYDRLEGARDTRSFIRAVLDGLSVEVRVSPAAEERVPRTGPLVIVANHPFGAIEGLALADAVLAVRPDVLVMANLVLGRIPELRPLFGLVDPFGTRRSARASAAGLRASLAHLESGGALVVFPAGEVSHLDLARRAVTDPAWSTTAVRLARRTGARVLPAHVAGANGPLFQVAGLVHPALRTALLPRELLQSQGRVLQIRLGRPLPPERLAMIPGDGEATAYLRQRAYALAGPRAHPRQGRPRLIPARRGAALPRVIDAVPPELMRGEVAALPSAQLMASCGELQAWVAGARQIPATVREIGRLRELTFRAVGEGSGNPVDLDRFDDHYLHLFVWHPGRDEVVGAYRLGPVDVIAGILGPRGLYTSTLFRMTPALIKSLGNAIELGRSFVRPEYQRGHQPLLLLWRGIGAFVAERPRYRHLFGPVSISQSYSRASQDLMVAFLRECAAADVPRGAVRPRRPFRSAARRDIDVGSIVPHLHGVDDLSELVAEIEADGKGVPVLLRQYLNLGGRILEFNVDPEFSGVVDGLILVDLARAERRLLDRYLGRERAEVFLSHHVTPPALSVA